MRGMGVGGGKGSKIPQMGTKTWKRKIVNCQKKRCLRDHWESTNKDSSSWKRSWLVKRSGWRISSDNIMTISSVYFIFLLFIFRKKQQKNNSNLWENRVENWMRLKNFSINNKCIYICGSTKIKRGVGGLNILFQIWKLFCKKRKLSWELFQWFPGE